MPIQYIISIMISCFIFTGCEKKEGNQIFEDITSTEIGEYITSGKTTLNEVRKKFGVPTEEAVENGQLVWKYIYSVEISGAKVSGLNILAYEREKTLRVTFNKNFVVDSYSFKAGTK